MTETTSYPDVDSRPYFEGLEAGEIRLQYCERCERYQFPPRVICTRCGASELTWRNASGRGRIYAMTINHRPAEEAFSKLGPYAVALVDLEEGVRVMARADVPVDEVKTGMDVLVMPEVEPILLPALVFHPEVPHAR